MITITKTNYIRWFKLGTLAALLTGCCPDADQKLHASSWSWSPYQVGQMVVFKTDNQDSVIFKVRKLSFTESGHDQVCGSYDIETSENILINQADTAFQFKVALTQEVLVKLDSYQGQPKKKNVEALFNSVSEHYISNDWRDQVLKEISLNGKVYRNVLHVYANYPLPGASFSEIYYAQNAGLIAFIDNRGKWYFIQE